MQEKVTDFLFVLMWPTMPQFAHLRAVPSLLPRLLFFGVPSSAPSASDGPAGDPAPAGEALGFALRLLASFAALGVAGDAGEFFLQFLSA